MGKFHQSGETSGEMLYFAEEKVTSEERKKG
jgi:hypothetical protein